MALFHLATLTPTKADAIAAWAPTQPWGFGGDVPINLIGSFRFDDPHGRVGLETHLVDAGGVLYQVPLTYRDEPLEGSDDALVCEMHHSALGTRWVYDGFRDPQFVLMLAAVTMTGQGEALGLAVFDGRWYIAPAAVRIQGGGWTQARVAVDGFEIVSDEDMQVTLRNDRFELVAHRTPTPGPRAPIALSATWDTQSEPVILATLTEFEHAT